MARLERFKLIFDNVRVSENNILGSIGRSFYSIIQNFQNERLVVSAMSMGEAQYAIDITLKYVRERKAFGHNL